MQVRCTVLATAHNQIIVPEELVPEMSKRGTRRSGTSCSRLHSQALMHALMDQFQGSKFTRVYPFHIKPLIAISNLQGCLYKTNGFGYRMTKDDRCLEQAGV
jgi:hypothetical protein